MLCLCLLFSSQFLLCVCAEETLVVRLGHSAIMTLNRYSSVRAPKSFHLCALEVFKYTCLHVCTLISLIACIIYVNIVRRRAECWSCAVCRCVRVRVHLLGWMCVFLQMGLLFPLGAGECPNRLAVKQFHLMNISHCVRFRTWNIGTNHIWTFLANIELWVYHASRSYAADMCEIRPLERSLCALGMVHGGYLITSSLNYLRARFCFFSHDIVEWENSKSDMMCRLQQQLYSFLNVGKLS